MSEYRDYAAGNAIFGNSLTLLERFDGLSSITDSEYSKVQSGWISPLAYAEEFGLNLVPKGPFSEQQLSIGQQWNVEVASQSRPEISRNVSLAAGVIAEGDALAGAPAVVILMSLFAVCVFFLLKYLEAWGNTLKVMAAFIVFSPDLYETGFLSLAAGINKSLQIGLVYWLVSIVVKSLHKNQVSNGL